MSCIMRKSDFCIFEYKGTDQLRGYGAADQCPCFCFIHLLQRLEVLSLLSVAVHCGLCLRAETRKTGFC